MAHECLICGQECYCDGEDHHQPTPADCSHECVDDDDDPYFDLEILGGPVGPHDQQH